MSEVRDFYTQAGVKAKPFYQEVVRLSVLGFKVKDIATLVNHSPGSISRILNSPLAIALRSALGDKRDAGVADVTREIEAEALACVETLRELRDISDQDGVRLKAALELLDRAGFSPVRKIRSETLSGKLSDEDIEQIKQSAGMVVVGDKGAWNTIKEATPYREPKAPWIDPMRRSA